MKIGISQPTFLPWQGYLALINHVDEFIILDDVQFDKRSWQQRNIIKQNDNKLLLTIPVKSKGKYDQKINEVFIDYGSDFIDKHLKSIFLSYKKSNHFSLYFKKIEEIYKKKFEKLSEINIEFIFFFLKEMNINTKISLSSNLNLKEKKHNLIKRICEIKNCSNFVSTRGSEIYLKDLAKDKINFEIVYYDFKNFDYKQIGSKFISNLSSLDLLFNLGKNSKEYLENNFYLIS